MNKSDFEFAKAIIADELLQAHRDLERAECDIKANEEWGCTADQFDRRREASQRARLHGILFASLCESIANCDK